METLECNNCHTAFDESEFLCPKCGHWPWDGGDGAAGALIEMLEEASPVVWDDHAVDLDFETQTYTVRVPDFGTFYCAAGRDDHWFIGDWDDEADPDGHNVVWVHCDPFVAWLNWMMYRSGHWGW